MDDSKFRKDFGFNIQALKITGGGTFSKTWMQTIADITKRKIICTSQPKHAGALGAAMCAMVGSKTFQTFEDIQKLVQIADTYIPSKENEMVYNQLFHTYQQLYYQLEKTYHTINKERFEQPAL